MKCAFEKRRLTLHVPMISNNYKHVFETIISFLESQTEMCFISHSVVVAKKLIFRMQELTRKFN